MLLNFAFCILGCAVLALMNVASFLYGLGFSPQSMTGGIPFWLLLLGAAVLPLLACVCCFCASLSMPERRLSAPCPSLPLPRIAVEAKEPILVEEPRFAEVVGR